MFSDEKVIRDIAKLIRSNSELMDGLKEISENSEDYESEVSVPKEIMAIFYECIHANTLVLRHSALSLASKNSKNNKEKDIDFIEICLN